MYLICALISIFSTCTAAATTIYYKDNGSPDYERINEDMEQERMEWISVEDETPEMGRRVLTHGNLLESPSIGYVVDDTPPFIIWSHVLQDDHIKITHWMPLPPLPCSKDEND